MRYWWLTQDAPEVNPSCFVSHIHVKCTTFLSAALLALPFHHHPYCFDDLWLLLKDSPIQKFTILRTAVVNFHTDGYKILNISSTAWEEVYIDASFFASGSEFHANVLSLWQVPVHFLFDLCTIYIFFYDVKKIKYAKMVWCALFDNFFFKDVLFLTFANSSSELQKEIQYAVCWLNVWNMWEE